MAAAVPAWILRIIINRYIPSQVKLGIAATKALKNLPGFVKSLGWRASGIRRQEFFRLYRQAKTWKERAYKWYHLLDKGSKLVPFGRYTHTPMADLFLYPVEVNYVDPLTGKTWSKWVSIYSGQRLTDRQVQQSVRESWVGWQMTPSSRGRIKGMHTIPYIRYR